MALLNRDLSSELIYSTSRSSGPGGQHVNKTDTKVELRFSVVNSKLLSEFQKKKLISKLGNKLTNDGELLLSAQSERSQLRNKDNVTKRFYKLLDTLLKPQKRRIATKPTLSSKIKRLDTKHRISEKKMRRKPDFD